MTLRPVAVAGVGMHRFGRFPTGTATDFGVTAAIAALRDAGTAWPSVQTFYCGASSVGNVAGNFVVDRLGRTGVEVVNVENASSSGSTAFRHAYLAVASGQVDVAMACGVGKMDREHFSDPRRALGGGEFNLRVVLASAQLNAASVFAMVARRRMHERGTDPEVLARIVSKSHDYGALNPYAHFQKPISVDEARNARMIADPLRLYDCCPTSEGGAAAVLTTTEIAEKLGRHPVVEVASSASRSAAESPSAWENAELTTTTADAAYKIAGVGPEDLDLFQVHDAFSNEELEYYEALRICAPGEAERLVMDGATGLGGRIPCNTDGGLLSRGHPIGPTGIAQVWETVLQLRGQAGQRQVPDARVGLCQMIGRGPVCTVHILRRK